MLLERCCTKASEVAEAFEFGAGRVELCERLGIGGVTPSAENIAASVAVGIPVNVLIRPRGGSFVYSEKEILEMLSGIRLCRELGANGIVTGALNPDGSICVETMRRLMAEAREGERRLEVTFHRAFDECRNPLDSMERIISLGCDRILTSGQEPTAPEGCRLIASLVRESAGRIIIMPGSGVTPENLEWLAARTGATEFHGTKLCRKSGPASGPVAY